MNNVIIFGIGTIGSALLSKLQSAKINVKYVVRRSGVLNTDFKKIAEQTEWERFVDNADAAFITIPSTTTGKQALRYASAFLKKGKPVITCEKASVAYHWDSLKKYKKLFLYTASVGGGSRMLRQISNYNYGEISEIKAVVNGTLNYIAEGIMLEKTKEAVVNEAVQKGYTEPGAYLVEDIIKTEFNDVILKTIIIANHSGIFSKTIREQDIYITPPNKNLLLTKRCMIYITKKQIHAGYIEDIKKEWLPDGVNNTMYINGKKVAFGSGAGADETTAIMLGDFHSLSNPLR